MNRLPIATTDAATPPDAFGPAPDIAALEAFLEIGDRLGVLPYLERGDVITTEALADAVDLPVTAVADLLRAYEAAAIVERVGDAPAAFKAVDSLPALCYAAGYVSWARNANKPFIENPREFLTDPVRARGSFQRDGRHIAVASQWMGSKGFYPALLSTVLDAKPSKAVDLGAGSARLLIEVLQALPDSTAVALDVDAGACAAATQAAQFAGVEDRLTVVERSIQSVATDAALLEGADVITAGFVFHDMLPEEEDVADGVLHACRGALNSGGILAITEAVPYASAGWERRFSALVTYMHQQFMGRRLLNETEWSDKLRSAGFSDVVCIRQAFPTGRLFVATAH